MSFADFEVAWFADLAESDWTDVATSLGGWELAEPDYVSIEVTP